MFFAFRRKMHVGCDNQYKTGAEDGELFWDSRCCWSAWVSAFWARRINVKFPCLSADCRIHTHGWVQVKIWILKGENSHAKCISKPCLLLSAKYLNPEIRRQPEKSHPYLYILFKLSHITLDWTVLSWNFRGIQKENLRGLWTVSCTGIIQWIGAHFFSVVRPVGNPLATSASAAVPDTVLAMIPSMLFVGAFLLAPFTCLIVELKEYSPKCYATKKKKKCSPSQ